MSGAQPADHDAPVNTRPPNPESHLFHARLGFVEVGTQDTEAGTKTVALYVKTLPPRA